MLMEINIQLLMEIGISPSEYVVLKLLHEKKYAMLESYCSKFGTTAYFELAQKGFFTIDDNGGFTISEDHFSKIVLRKDFLEKLFTVKEGMFYEFFMQYPMKVPSSRTGTGTRILRPKNDESVEGQRLKKKYEQLVKGSVDKHKHIMACLKAELAERNRSNSTPFMQELSTWLNQCSYQRYEHLVEIANQEQEVSEAKYGEQLI